MPTTHQDTHPPGPPTGAEPPNVRAVNRPPDCQACGRRHRSWSRYAGCVLGPLEWVIGDGPWGSLSLCPRGTTLILFPDRGEAEQAKQLVDRTRCGGACVGRHEVIDLRTLAGWEGGGW